MPKLTIISKRHQIDYDVFNQVHNDCADRFHTGIFSRILSKKTDIIMEIRRTDLIKNSIRESLYDDKIS